MLEASKSNVHGHIHGKSPGDPYNTRGVEVTDFNHAVVEELQNHPDCNITARKFHLKVDTTFRNSDGLAAIRMLSGILLSTDSG
jgi:hypothetical protein